MDAQLFVELSEEQQELVAGGGQLTDLDDYLDTYFKAENSVVDFQAMLESGPDGSTVMQDFSQDFTAIDTGAKKDFSASFD
jgi:hypothetical protein